MFEHHGNNRNITRVMFSSEAPSNVDNLDDVVKKNHYEALLALFLKDILTANHWMAKLGAVNWWIGDPHVNEECYTERIKRRKSANTTNVAHGRMLSNSEPRNEMS